MLSIPELMVQIRSLTVQGTNLNGIDGLDLYDTDQRPSLIAIPEGNCLKTQDLPPDFEVLRLEGVLSFVRNKTSPGWHLKARQILSSVSKLMPTALPFFSRHSVVWLTPVSFASQ